MNGNSHNIISTADNKGVDGQIDDKRKQSVEKYGRVHVGVPDNHIFKVIKLSKHIQFTFQPMIMCSKFNNLLNNFYTDEMEEFDFYENTVDLHLNGSPWTWDNIHSGHLFK